MHFAGYDIDLAKVIGVGPLTVERANDKAVQMLYGPQRYYFQIFFENYSAEISTTMLSTIGIDENLKNANRQKLLDFENGYVEVRAFVIDQISKAEKVHE